MNHTIRDSTIDAKNPEKSGTPDETKEGTSATSKHFIGISPKPRLEDLGPKWRKPAPPSHILFGTDGLGQVCVIEHEGPDASYLMQESREHFVEEELATWKFPGLWVWVGKVRSSRSYEGEYDEHYEGTIRPLTEDERQAVRENEMLWDPAIWVEPPHVVVGLDPASNITGAAVIVNGHLVAAAETHEWVGKCGIVTEYESTGDEEYREGDIEDCVECDDPNCTAKLKRKVPRTAQQLADLINTGKFAEAGVLLINASDGTVSAEVAKDTGHVVIHYAEPRVAKS
jgi:hypothetical protein